MAKSARASSRKTNNQKLKKNVFGPVETARTERLSAKLMELVAQEVPAAKQDKDDADAMEAVAGEAVQDPTPSAQLRDENTETMDVDSAAALGKSIGRKRIEKRKVRKSSIVFRRYKDRSSKKRK